MRIRSSLVSVCILLIAVSLHAQAPIDGVLLDEFPVDTGCEDVLSRTDALGSELGRKSGKAGFIVVFGGDDENSRARRTADFIHRALIGRWGLAKQYKIIGVPKTEDARVQFRLIPADSLTQPLPGGKLLANVPFEVTKRYYFGVQSADPCTNHIAGGFASVIKSDDKYVGQLVIYNVPEKEHAESAETWLKYFREEHRLGRRRIRVFFKRGNGESFLKNYYTEFWIRPKSS